MRINTKDFAEEMRNCPTDAEKAFMDRLIEARIIFRFQVVIGCYIADFVIGKTVVEVDGSSHNKRKEYDRKRTDFLKSMGYNVIRVKNRNVLMFDLSIFDKHKAPEFTIKLKKGQGLRHSPKKKAIKPKHSWSSYH